MIADHPARAGRVEDVPGNRALLLEIDVPARDSRGASVQRQAGDPGNAETEADVPHRARRALSRPPDEFPVRAVLAPTQPLTRHVEGEKARQLRGHRRFQTPEFDLAGVPVT